MAGYARDVILADDAPLAVKVFRGALGSMRGAVGTPAQITDLCRRYEAVGVDQIGFVLQAGTNKHEDICEALELFGKEVIPQFAEQRDEKERAKAQRLAPAIERALARRSPPRVSPPRYRIDEDAEIERARRARRVEKLDVRAALSRGRHAVRTTARRRAQRELGRWTRSRSDEQIEKRFGSKVAQRAIFSGMARAFEPSMAFGFEGELQFVMARPATGGPTQAWTITVTDSKAVAHARPAADPRVTLRAGVADFVRIATGEANPGALLLDGKLEVEGDLDLAPRLSEMFGGPSPY